MSPLILSDFKSVISNKGFLSMEGSARIKHIEITSGDFEEFLDLASRLDVKQLFLNFEELTGDDIEHRLITDDILEDVEIPSEILDEVKKDIKKHNNEINELKKYVGTLINIEIFFCHDGLVYVFQDENLDLVTVVDEEPSESLEYIVDNYSDVISEMRSKKFEEGRKKRAEILIDLEKDLLQHPEFTKCKNKTLRKDFAWANLDKKYGKDIPHFFGKEISEVVERVWRKINYHDIV